MEHFIFALVGIFVMFGVVDSKPTLLQAIGSDREALYNYKLAKGAAAGLLVMGVLECL